MSDSQGEGTSAKLVVVLTTGEFRLSSPRAGMPRIHETRNQFIRNSTSALLVMLGVASAIP